jgi:hypothetical protein
MKEQQTFRKTAGWLALLSVPFAYANFALTGLAGGGEQDIYELLRIGGQAGQIMKWSWLADMFGYYLLLVPAIFVLHFWLKGKNPYWMVVFTFCAIAYVLCGSTGAAMLAKTWPTLISAYESAQGINKEIIDVVFTNTTEMVYGGLWGYLEFLLAGIWWIGIGTTVRSERKAFGVVSIVLGVFAVAAMIGEVFNIELITITGLMIYLLLGPVWAGWLGIHLLRGKDIQLATA